MKRGIKGRFCGETGYSGIFFLYIPCRPWNCHWMLPMCAGPVLEELPSMLLICEGLSLEKLSLDAADVCGACPGEIVIGCYRCGRGCPWRNCHWMLPMWEGPSLEKLPSDATDVGGASPGVIAIGGCRCVRGLPWRNCHWMLPMWVVPALEELSLEAADVGRGWPWSNCHRRLPMWEGLALEELPSEAADVGGACPGGIVIGCCRCVRGLPLRIVIGGC